jgi:5-oxoprolinase (ATP-hydrolysing) subunit C
MNNGLKVIAPGAYSTVQDFGRFGFQDMGVPVSGALDAQSLRLANFLVGNASGVAGLEVLHSGPTLEVTAEQVCVALGGIGARLELSGDKIKTIPAWQSVILQKGQVFKVLMEAYSFSCYLAISGGLDLPLCMGSLSTYVRSGFGGFEGRPLQIGDELQILRAEVASEDCYHFAAVPKFLTTPPANVVQIKVTWGAQKDYFAKASLGRFLEVPYTIQPDSDRMGYRLSGEKLEFCDNADIVSDGIATGAIQVPGSGQPIVLLADHQTTGGYPKIATVVSADLPMMGRLRPEQEISFSVVEIDEAENLAREQEETTLMLEDSMQAVAASTQVNIEALWSENLISGVVNGSN